MARTKVVTELGQVAHEDMLYAVRCLIDAGKTTAREVTQLAGDRGTRIATLKAELAALEGGKAVAVAPAATRVKRAYHRRAKPATKAVPAPRPSKKAAAAGRAKGRVGRKIVRSDGRSFTVTAAVVESRKLQGQYLGNLRKIPEKERDRYRAIVKAKGVAAAVAAIKKRLGIA